MSLSQFAQHCPSFSLVMTTTEGFKAPTSPPPRHRKIKFEELPMTPRIATKDNSAAFMRTIDTRFESNLVYEVVYAQEGRRIEEDSELDDDSDASFQSSGHEPQNLLPKSKSSRWLEAFWTLLRSARGIMLRRRS